MHPFYLQSIIFDPKHPRVSAHKIGFAEQIPKNREHVYRFFDLEREKSFCTGTFFRPCSAKSEHFYPGNEVFGIKKSHPADASQLVTCTTHAGGFSVWYVCASNIRVYPGGLLLSIKTFRSPVLKMWVKKGLLSNRAGSYRNKMLCFR